MLGSFTCRLGSGSSGRSTCLASVREALSVIILVEMRFELKADMDNFVEK
jgi:hypothetical protein